MVAQRQIKNEIFKTSAGNQRTGLRQMADLKMRFRKRDLEKALSEIKNEIFGFENEIFEKALPEIKTAGRTENGIFEIEISEVKIEIFEIEIEIFKMRF